jgi:hypothetical protein
LRISRVRVAPMKMPSNIQARDADQRRATSPGQVIRAACPHLGRVVIRSIIAARPARSRRPAARCPAQPQLRSAAPPAHQRPARAHRLAHQRLGGKGEAVQRIGGDPPGTAAAPGWRPASRRPEPRARKTKVVKLTLQQDRAHHDVAVDRPSAAGRTRSKSRAQAQSRQARPERHRAQSHRPSASPSIRRSAWPPPPPARPSQGPARTTGRARRSARSSTVAAPAPPACVPPRSASRSRRKARWSPARPRCGSRGTGRASVSTSALAGASRKAAQNSSPCATTSASPAAPRSSARADQHRPARPCRPRPAPAPQGPRCPCAGTRRSSRASPGSPRRSHRADGGRLPKLADTAVSTAPRIGTVAFDSTIGSAIFRTRPWVMSGLGPPLSAPGPSGHQEMPGRLREQAARLSCHASTCTLA